MIAGAPTLRTDDMGRRRTFNSWTEYVRSVVGTNERQVDIARRSGLDQTTVSRWLNAETRSITPSSVAKFARAYDRPVLEAFVVAGFLTQAEAGLKQNEVVDLTGIKNAQLVRELNRRLAQDEEQDAEPQQRQRGRERQMVDGP